MYRGRRKYRTYWTIFLILAAAVVLGPRGRDGAVSPKGYRRRRFRGAERYFDPAGDGEWERRCTEVDDSSAIPPDSSNPSGDLTEEPDQPEEKDEPEAGYDFFPARSPSLIRWITATLMTRPSWEIPVPMGL